MAITNILTKKQGGSFSLIDAGLTSVSKSLVVDGLATPLMNKVTKGNKIFNVGAKVIGASLVGKLISGKYGKIVADSLVLSAGDEVVSAFLGKKTGVAVNEAFIGGDDSFGGANKQMNGSNEIFI